MHQKARAHSYVNIGWTICCLILTAYFGYFYLFVETDISCIALVNPEFTNLPQEGISKQSMFLRFEKMEDMLYHIENQKVVDPEYYDVGDRFDQSLKIVFYQALIQFLVGVANSLSHFFIP